MSEETTNIKLPHMSTNQAQKETTYNEAIDKVDFFVARKILAFVSALPSSPSEGDGYILTTNNNIAHYLNGAWEYYTPADGMDFLCVADQKKYIYKNSAWAEYTPSIKVGTVTTGEAGTDVEVKNSGDDINAAFDFKIPKGNKGDTGETGPQGPQGVQGDPGLSDIATTAEAEAGTNDTKIITPAKMLNKLSARVQRSLSYTWAELHTKISAGDFSGIEVGDYKDITLTSGTVMRMVVAGINTFKGTGYATGADGGTPNHIDFISQDCYPTSHTVNTTDNNNGNASQTNPFMASALYSWLNGTVSALLPSDVTAVISNKSCLMADRYASGSALTDDNGWAWKTPGPLWLPNEVEVFGVDVFSTRPWSVGGGGCNKQYEIFRKYPEQLIKHTTNGGTARANWWLCSAHSGSSTHFCIVGGDGAAGAAPATCADIYVPLCFSVI